LNTLIVKHLLRIFISMKKDVVLTVRIDSKMHSLIHSLARSDERTIAWMARKLIEEALRARNLISNGKK